jgi:hypothetical protein
LIQGINVWVDDCATDLLVNDDTAMIVSSATIPAGLLEDLRVGGATRRGLHVGHGFPVSFHLALVETRGAVRQAVIASLV